MPDIRQLSPSVVNKIAAGEVIERPASVVKELIENAIDAGANRIDVAVEQGGAELIRAVDDGCGMLRDDALLAFERHATSKLRDVKDLLSIATLGFRGEALPTIAAISRLKAIPSTKRLILPSAVVSRRRRATAGTGGTWSTSSAVLDGV